MHVILIPTPIAIIYIYWRRLSEGLFNTRMRLDLWVWAYKTASSNIHTLKRNHQPITSPNKLLDLGKIPQPPAVDKANQKDLEDSCRWRLRPLRRSTRGGASYTPYLGMPTAKLQWLQDLYKLKANFKDDSCLEAIPKKVTGKPLNPQFHTVSTNPRTPRIGQWHFSSPGDLVTGEISFISSVATNRLAGAKTGHYFKLEATKKQTEACLQTHVVLGVIDLVVVCVVDWTLSIKIVASVWATWRYLQHLQLQQF